MIVGEWRNIPLTNFVSRWGVKGQLKSVALLVPVTHQIEGCVTLPQLWVAKAK